MRSWQRTTATRLIRKEELPMKMLIVYIALCSGIAFASPAQVIIIRHAEKGTGNDLSPQGYQHAQELVSYFESNPDVTQYGTPIAIYAMSPSEDDPSNRAVETVTPLAGALGLTLQGQFSKMQIQQVASAVMSDAAYSGKMVLICWEHKVIPDLAVALGVSPEPPKWDKDDFDSVYRIDFDAQGAVTKFDIFTQQLAPAQSPRSGGKL